MAPSDAEGSEACLSASDDDVLAAQQLTPELIAGLVKQVRRRGGRASGGGEGRHATRSPTHMEGACMLSRLPGSLFLVSLRLTVLVLAWAALQSEACG